MARPRSLPVEDILLKSMQVFWQRGYSATSMSDIYEATGLKAGSLYAAFKDKEELFRFTLESYAGYFRASLPRDLFGLAAIEAWLRSQAVIATSDPQRRGCLLINTITERTAHSEATQAIAMRLLEEARQFFHDNLRVAKSNGEVCPSLNIEVESDALIGVVVSIMGLARAGCPETMIWNVALAPLDGLRSRSA